MIKRFGLLLVVAVLAVGLLATEVFAMPVVEVLRFRIPVAEQATFLELDAAVWGQALKQQPGYVGRSLWRSPTDPDILQINITWETRALWKAFPEAKLADLDAQMGHFAAALEQVSEYELIANETP